MKGLIPYFEEHLEGFIPEKFNRDFLEFCKHKFTHIHENRQTGTTYCLLTALIYEAIHKDGVTIFLYGLAGLNQVFRKILSNLDYDSIEYSVNVYRFGNGSSISINLHTFPKSQRFDGHDNLIIAVDEYTHKFGHYEFPEEHTIILTN